MPARVHGPLLEDYVRAIKAAKRMGWRVVRIEIGNSAIALVQDETYLRELTTGQPPAPATAAQEGKSLW